MAAHLKALLGVTLAILLVATAFFFLNKPVVEVEGPPLDIIEEMKIKGVPKFKSQDLDGQGFDLENLKGKILIINFWASWCEPCVEEVPSLVSLVSKLKGKAQLIAISGDSDRKEVDSFLKAFPELKNENISLIWDEDKSLMKSYAVGRLPETFIVNQNFRLVKKVVGSVRWDHPESISYFEHLIQNP